MELEPGAKLGPYEVICAAGAGGMGEVYRAKDTRLDREVALKILPPDLSRDEQLRRRFEREAKTVSSLNHPHICTLYDVGEHEGTSYLVMEYCEGESLGERLAAKGALPTDQLLRYGAQIADALDKAHRQGVVHRDLKPANIMLTKAGPKLLDFGLAKYADPSGMAELGAPLAVSSLPTEEGPLTEEGTILGTFHYMAPEQLEGQEADARADIFSLGAVLYEMATGRRAFEGKSRASLIASILDRHPPPISSVQPLTPPAFDHVVQKCLEKDPDDRWQSTHDVASQLRWISDAGSQAGVAAPVTVRRKTRERAAWALAAVALVSAVALALLYFRPQPPPEVRTLRSYLLAPQGTSFDFTQINSGSLAVSPNGRHVAFTVLAEDGTRSLWLRSLDSLEARRLSGTDGALHPFWSPDSRFVAFFAEGRLKKVDITGAPPLALCEAPDGRSGSWNGAGVILFSPNTLTPIHRVAASGGEAAPVTSLATDQGETTHRWVHFLPDGRHFLFMAATHTLGTRSEANAIYLGSLDSQERTLLFHARSNVVYASGQLLYVRDHVLVAQPFDPGTLKLTGDPAPIAEPIQYARDYFRGVFSASKTGLLVYQSGAAQTSRKLVWLDRRGEEIASIERPVRFEGFFLSPDGTRFAGGITDEASGNSDIWIYDLERDVPMRFTFGELSEFAPIWSPAGTRVAFAALKDSENALDADVYVKSASGDAPEELLVDTEEWAIPTAWSPDGRFLAVTSFDVKNDADLWFYPMEGDGQPVAYLERDFNDLWAIFSPDGRRVAYLSDESGRQELYVAPFPGPGGKWQISTEGAQGAVWRGDEIVYQALDNTVMSVPVEADASGFRAGSPVALFKDDRLQSFDLTADGQRFLALITPEAERDTPLTLVTNWHAGLGR